jgi:hypothetical protein
MGFLNFSQPKSGPNGNVSQDAHDPLQAHSTGMLKHGKRLATGWRELT